MADKKRKDKDTEPRRIIAPWIFDNDTNNDGIEEEEAQAPVEQTRALVPAGPKAVVIVTAPVSDESESDDSDQDDSSTDDSETIDIQVESEPEPEEAQAQEESLITSYPDPENVQEEMAEPEPEPEMEPEETEAQSESSIDNDSEQLADESFEQNADAVPEDDSEAELVEPQPEPIQEDLSDFDKEFPGTCPFCYSDLQMKDFTRSHVSYQCESECNYTVIVDLTTGQVKVVWSAESDGNKEAIEAYFSRNMRCPVCSEGQLEHPEDDSERLECSSPDCPYNSEVFSDSSMLHEFWTLPQDEIDVMREAVEQILSERQAQSEQPEPEEEPEAEPEPQQQPVQQGVVTKEVIEALNNTCPWCDGRLIAFTSSSGLPNAYMCNQQGSDHNCRFNIAVGEPVEYLREPCKNCGNREVVRFRPLSKGSERRISQEFKFCWRCALRKEGVGTAEIDSMFDPTQLAPDLVSQPIMDVSADLDALIDKCFCCNEKLQLKHVDDQRIVYECCKKKGHICSVTIQYVGVWKGRVHIVVDSLSARSSLNNEIAKRDVCRLCGSKLGQKRESPREYYCENRNCRYFFSVDRHRKNVTEDFYLQPEALAAIQQIAQAELEKMRQQEAQQAQVKASAASVAAEPADSVQKQQPSSSSATSVASAPIIEAQEVVVMSEPSADSSTQSVDNDEHDPEFDDWAGQDPQEHTSDDAQKIIRSDRFRTYHVWGLTGGLVLALILMFVFAGVGDCRNDDLEKRQSSLEKEVPLLVNKRVKELKDFEVKDLKKLIQECKENKLDCNTYRVRQIIGAVMEELSNPSSGLSKKFGDQREEMKKALLEELKSQMPKPAKATDDKALQALQQQNAEQEKQINDLKKTVTDLENRKPKPWVMFLPLVVPVAEPVSASVPAPVEEAPVIICEEKEQERTASVRRVPNSAPASIPAADSSQKVSAPTAASRPAAINRQPRQRSREQPLVIKGPGEKKGSIGEIEYYRNCHGTGCDNSTLTIHP